MCALKTLPSTDYLYPLQAAESALGFGFGQKQSTTEEEKTFIVLIEPCWPSALDPTNLMSPSSNLLLIKLNLFLGAKASFAPTMAMTKLHLESVTGSKYQMALSQTLSRKVSMSL